MAITNPISGASIRVALAFQVSKGTAAAVPAGRAVAIGATRGAGLVREDPQGLPPGGGYVDNRVFAAAQVPVVTLTLVAEPNVLSDLLESVTGGTPVVAGGTTTFVWSDNWPGRWMTVWVDDGVRAARWTDAAVTDLVVETDGSEGAVATATMSALDHQVIATALGATGSAVPGQWTHADHLSTVNAIASSPTRSALRVTAEHESWGGFWDPTAGTGGVGMPEDLVLHRHVVTIDGDLPPSDEAANRAAAALADSEHAAEWSWTRGADILRAVVPRARSGQADLFDLAAGEVSDQPYIEEARAGSADADSPATITLES